MASTYSTNLRIEIQATGENRGSWGTKANNDLTLIEAAVAGNLTIAMPDANKTLTAINGAPDESRPLFLKFTGTLTAGRTVTIPTVSKFYFMQNATTGGFPLTISAGGATTYVLQPSGSPGTQWKLIFTDGISVWSNDALLTSSSVSQRWNIAPFIDATGVMETGQKIDFHNSNTDTNDWNVRLETGGTTTDLYITPQGGTGRKIWDAGNGGPGSGLNADLLDGYHASDIQFVDAPADGKNYVRRNNTWVAIDAPFSIDPANGDVTLKFGATTVIRIKSTGLILTKDDVEVFSTSV